MLPKNNIQKLSDWVINTPTLFKLNDPVHEVAPFSHISQKSICPYSGNPRLGFVYQYVCQQLFQLSGRYSIIKEEIQLHQHGRTLGAIDFILKNQETQAIEHWEVAIKFYLLHNTLWYGPNAQDRLDLKLNKMLKHQLKMSSSKPFYNRFPELEFISEHLLMQGRLYTNPFHTEELSLNCLDHQLNPSRIKGHWCYKNQMHHIKDKLYILDKKDWITGKDENSILFEGEVNKFVHCQAENGMFWFIMNDQWPN